MSERAGAFSPLVHRAFRFLWFATVIANIGVWMQMLGAQWFLVSSPNSASLVALVQVALMAPMALLALPAGVLADSMNRRTLLIIVQSATLVFGVVLTVLNWTELLTPALLLVLTALLGSGNALTLTPFQSLIPDLVARDRIQPAAALIGVSANIARVAGPAIAGFLVAWLGITAVFLLNAVTTAVFLIVLILWSGRVAQARHRERFFPAIRSGMRYVRHSPQVLKLMLRSSWFAAPMMAIFALLPLVATERLNMDSSGYGLLFACLGAGAVAGGLSVARIRHSFTANTIVAATMVMEAAVIIALPFVSWIPLAMALMLIAGSGWTISFGVMAGTLQVYLPAWVRARGLSIYAMALFGGQAVGSLIMGALSDAFGLTNAMLIAGVMMVIGVVFAFVAPIKELALDRTPTQYWPEPDLVVNPDEIGGEVTVTISYWITAEREAEFFERMQFVRRIRLRTGATSWRLMRDGETPGRFIEEYTVGSWREHEYQHQMRLVASDKEYEDRAIALSDPPPVVNHLFRLDVH